MPQVMNQQNMPQQGTQPAPQQEQGMPPQQNMPQTVEIGGELQAPQTAMPIPQQAGDGTPTAANGQLLDDVSAPENNPDYKGATDLQSAKDLFAQAFDNYDANPEPPISPMLKATEGKPSPLPEGFGKTPHLTPAEQIAQMQNGTGNQGIEQLLDASQQSGQQGSLNPQNSMSQPNNANQARLRPEDMEEIKQMILGAVGQSPAEPTSNTQSDPFSQVPEQAVETEPELDLDSDEFYSKFSDNPGAAIKEIADQIAARKISQVQGDTENKMAELTQKLQPLLEQSEQLTQRNNSVNAMRQFLQKGNGQYDDFKELIPAITEIMRSEQMPLDNPSSFENAYSRAKNMKLQQQLQEAEAMRGKTLDDYFGDDNAIEQMSQNDALKQKVISEYLQGLQQGQAPAQIGNNSYNNPVGNARNKADSFKDAGKMFASLMNA